MKYLLHCIFEHDGDQPPLTPGLCLVAVGGLAAAATRVQKADTGLSSLLEYARAIEAIDARTAVIPLRYGCLMENEQAVARLLEEHGQEYGAILKRLRGMTEMSVRLIRPRGPELSAARGQSPGAAYLASLRSRYGLTSEETELAEEILGLLSGCYRESRTEISVSSESRAVSVYFLVAKTQVGCFQRKVREVHPPAGTKVQVSGPWPAYNFAVTPGVFHGAVSMEAIPP